MKSSYGLPSQEKWDCGSEPKRSYRLYFGARHGNPFERIFGFFPCRRRIDAQDVFARPAIRAPQFITDNHRQGKRLNPQFIAKESRRRGDTYVRQVLRQGNQMGVYVEIPERREIHGNTQR